MHKEGRRLRQDAHYCELAKLPDCDRKGDSSPAIDLCPGSLLSLWGTVSIPLAAASGHDLALHMFCYVLENGLSTLRTQVGELDPVALLVSPGHCTNRVNGYTRNG
jgi:hypothetical protein